MGAVPVGSPRGATGPSTAVESGGGQGHRQVQGGPNRAASRIRPLRARSHPAAQGHPGDRRSIDVVARDPDERQVRGSARADPRRRVGQILREKP